MRNPIFICICFCCFSILKTFGQVADFLIPNSTCLNEGIQITDGSTDIISYEWDFCLDGLSSDPISSDLTLSGVSNGYGVELVKDGETWYGFVLGKSDSSITRLDFGDSPLNPPTQVNLGNPGSILAKN